MLYLLRHGETEWSRVGRKQGRSDSPLTSRGVAQARSCARALADDLLDPSTVQLVTSPLGRARATAEIVRGVLGLHETAVAVQELLAEHDYGEWEGLTNAEIETRFPGRLAARKRDHWNFIVPGGESYARVAARVAPWLDHQDAAAHTIAVVHEMVSRVLRGLYLDLPSRQVLALTHSHTRVYVLHRGRVRSIEAA